MIMQLNSSGVQISNVQLNIVPTTASLASQRSSVSMTMSDPTVAYARPMIYGSVNIGQAVDITFRIGAPQLELGTFATSVILPPVGAPAAQARAADVATMPLDASWFNAAAYTIAAEHRI